MLDFRTLHTFLCDHLSIQDLPDLAAVFGCDHEDLGGSGKQAKFREFILWTQRRGQDGKLASLIATLDLFSRRLDFDEVRTIAFDLGIDYEELGGGSGKVSKILQLFIAVARRGLSRSLEIWFLENRPDIDLSQVRFY